MCHRPSSSCRSAAPSALRLGCFLAAVLALTGVRMAAQEAAPALNPPTDSDTAIVAAWKPPRFTARQRDRDAMVRVIRRFYRLTDQAVLTAMGAVPRHEFVPRNQASRAYQDTPLPILHGQTISQPFMVAEMTRLLELDPDAKVLEVGTGSGYQAAVLTEFTPNVFTVEIIKPLADSAKRRFQDLGYTTVKTANRDGYHGWPEHAPFDAIIVTCAAGQIPPPLIKQLAPGGKMVIPVGAVFATQSLMLVEKDEEGKVFSRSLMAVRFVPLLRKDTSRRR